MTDPAVQPPGHLQAEGRRFYEQMVEEYDFEIHELRLLRLAAEQVDLQHQARRSVRQGGITITAKSGAIKPNPALSVERQATRLLQSLLRQLALPIEDERPRYAGQTPGGRKHRSPRRPARGAA